jgi:hypothetical protein
MDADYDVLWLMFITSGVRTSPRFIAESLAMIPVGSALFSATRSGTTRRHTRNTLS